MHQMYALLIFENILVETLKKNVLNRVSPQNNNTKKL